MAKRYTSTVKWEDDWFVSLEPMHKLFWAYVCDKCDHAGVWQVSASIPSRLIGATIDLESARAAFGDRVDDSKQGYWRLTKFLEFQYGLPLVPSNKVHASAIRILEGHGFDSSPFKAPSMPQASPYVGVKERDKDKDSLPKALVLNADDFDAFWTSYPTGCRGKGSKQKARQSWDKQKPPLVEVQAALKWQRKQERWTSNNGQFIPDAVTYLNGRSWEDENPNAHKNNFKNLGPRRPPEPDEPMPF